MPSAPPSPSHDTACFRRRLIGQAVWQRREALGFERAVLAARARVPVEMVVDIEEGRIQPDQEVLQPICDALGLDQWAVRQGE